MISASTSLAAAAPKPTGPPIPIMQIHEKTAGIATKDLADGAIAAVKAINRAGGINGRRLKFIECDTRNDPNAAAECARTAVAKNVVAVVGSLTIFGDYYPELVQNKIASLGNIPANSGDFTSPASFPVVGGAPVAFPLLAVGLTQQGAKNISLVRPDVAAGAVIKSFVNQGLAPEGLSLINDIPVPQNAPDMSGYAQAAIAGGTDGVVVGLSGQDALNFVQSLRQTDPSIKVAMAATDFNAAVKALGKQANGIITFTYTYSPPIKNAAIAKYKRALKAAGVPGSGFNESDIYTAVLVFEAIAKELPDITASALYDKLPTVTGITTGMAPPVQFTTGGVAGLPRVFSSCGLLYAIKRGVPRPISGKFLDPFTGDVCPVS
jgi:ABC-type branched-subunit amino acid transport system substrate-binding protein